MVRPLGLSGKSSQASKKWAETFGKILTRKKDDSRTSNKYYLSNQKEVFLVPSLFCLFFKLVCISLRITYVEFHHLVYTLAFLIFPPPPFSVNKESSFPHVMSPLNFRFLIFGLIPTVSIIPLDKITSTEKRLFYFMQKFSLKWAFSCGNSVRESQFVAKNKIE